MRGSCRALKWMALFGVVFALGAGEAAAQITIDGTAPTTLMEGVGTTINLEIDAEIPTGTNADTMTLSVSGTGVTSTVLRFNVPANSSGSAVDFDETGSIVITPGEDANVDDETSVTLTFKLNDGGLQASGGTLTVTPATLTVTIEDDDMRGYRLTLITPMADREEAEQIEFLISPTHELTTTAEPPVQLELSEEYTLSGTGVTPTPGEPGKGMVALTATDPLASILFTAPKDADSDDQTVTLKALWGTISEPGEAVASVTLTDPDPAALTFSPLSQAPISVAVGEDVETQLPKATGGEEPYEYAVTPALPDGLELDEDTGMLSGEPTKAADAAVFTYTATDSNTPTKATGSLTFIITVTAATTTPADLTFTPAAVPTIPALVADTPMAAVTMPEATGGTMPYMYSITPTLPLGLMFDETTRMLSGTPTAASAATTYTYTAEDDATPAVTGSLPFMITVTATTTPPTTTTLATPTGFTATAGNAQVTLAWTPVSGATGYEYSQNLGAWTAAGTGPSFVVVGLVNGTAYSFRLRAVNATGQSLATAAVAVTPTTTTPTTTTLAKPTGFKATAGNAQVTLEWKAVTGATGYEYSSNLGSWTPAGTGTSFVVVSLTNGTAYSFRLRAVNEVTESDPTTAVTATPTATVTPTTPTDGIITAIRVGTATTAPERTVGGVARVHVTEGTTTDVNVTVEWNHAQVTALWEGHTAASPPEPAMVRVVVMPDSDTAGAAWLSKAEDGADAILQTDTVSIAIPAKPTATQEPDAVNRFKSATGKTSLSLAEDVDAEDEGFRVNVVAGSGDLVSTSGSRGRTTTDRLNVIVDDETQGIKLSRDPASTAAIFEGATVTLKAVAAPARVNLPLKVRYSVTDLDGVAVSSRLYTLDGGTGEIPVGTGAAAKDTVKFSTPKNDGNREDNEFTIHADVQSFDLVSGAFDDIAESTVDITVLDVHMLPVLTISPMEGTVKEGDSVELELTLDRNPPRDRARRTGGEKRDVTSEAVTVMLSAGAGSTAGMDDYMLPAAVTFEKHSGKAPWEQTAMVDVMVRADDELDAGEVLMLDAMVAGTVAANGDEKSTQAGLAMLTIEEGTGKLVWALEESVVMKAVYDAIEAGAGEDMIVTEGETIMLEGNDVFGAAEGVSVSYSSDSSDDDVASDSVSGGMITVTAMGEGMAEITVTAHASSPSGVKIMDQTDPTEASIKFPVEVGLEALSIMLSGPDEMNLVEGGMGGMVTAMANREVTEAVTITLMRDRAMSTAGDDDYMAEAITIEAGMMSGTTMVMAVADEMMENMDNMPEELVLYGMAADNAGEVTGEVKFYIWDAAVPALPIIAQLLLAAFLAIGGFRRYRRR